MFGAFRVPDEVALVELFGSDPVERSVESGHWCYEVAGKGDVVLRFSFNILEQSVQTALRVAGVPLATVVHEGAQAMSIDGDTLTCRFSFTGVDTTLVLRLGDSMNLQWSSLRRS